MQRTRAFGLVVLAVLPACSRSSSASDAGTAAALSLPSLAAASEAQAADTVGAASPPPTKPDARIGQLSVARFTGETLKECDDVTLVVHGGDATKNVQEMLEKGMLLSSKTKKPDELMKLNKRCSEQFTSNPTLASCDLRHTEEVTDAGVSVGSIDQSADVYYYDLDTLTRSDGAMKDCMKMGGNWQGLDKTSDVYFDAVRARARRNAERLLGR